MVSINKIALSLWIGATEPNDQIELDAGHRELIPARLKLGNR